jgi:heat shock protein HslJ
MAARPKCGRRNRVRRRFERLIPGAVLLLILLLLVGCRPEAPTIFVTRVVTATPARDPLNGTRWVLLSLYGKPPLEGSRITLEFSGGFIRGFSGCNWYRSVSSADDVAGGKYEATEDGSLKIPGELEVTARAPVPPAGVPLSFSPLLHQERAYLRALHSAVAYRLVENRLEIQDAAGETILVFTK